MRNQEMRDLMGGVERLNGTIKQLSDNIEQLDKRIKRWITLDVPEGEKPLPDEPGRLQVPDGELPPWLDLARTYIGIDEEADEDTVIAFSRHAGTPIESSETPWCAIFVNAMLGRCNLKMTGTARAMDFADWGQECEEQVGAVVVYRSHVGFVPEIGKVLGGNQSDGVNVGQQSWYGKPIGYRWPEEYAV